MIKNYLKIAIRNLWRKKGFSLINIIGLAIGMASAILILLWIQNECTYDNFHTNKDRIYEAWNRSVISNKIKCWNVTPPVLAKVLPLEYPEVESVVRVDWTNDVLFTVGEKQLLIRGNIVDSNFLSMFSFPLLSGNPKTVLNGVYSIVITEKTAKTLFGAENPMGKIINLKNKDNFTVTGVLKDLPNNSRFDFEYLLPWAYLKTYRGDDENWNNNSTINYVMLKPNTSFASIESKIKTIKRKYDKDDPDSEMFLYPMNKWRLYSKFENGKESGGLIELVRMFGIIAAFILLIACINFMNLSTARSEKRAKEVGIRKVVGAQKNSLISQFLGESILISFVAGIIALYIVQLSLNGFNELIGKHLFIDYTNVDFWLFFVGFILFTGIIAGSYPAFYLSSFNPTVVLKGTFQKINASITPRKVLIILQFAIAVILIISTLIIREQIKYAQNRETGYQKGNLTYHYINGDIGKNYSLIKNELLSSGAAIAVCKTRSPITQGWDNTWGLEWAGKAPNDRTEFDRYRTDDNLVNTVGLQLVQGRDFNLKDYPTDSTAVLLNESAVRAMNFKDPIGQIIKDDIDWHVIGVIKDFIIGSPFYPTKPMVIEGSKLPFLSFIHVKLNEKNSSAKNLQIEEQIFKKYNHLFPFSYHFVDEEYEKKFNAEQRIGILSGLFAALTIFISCLGLFGLATYMAENRIKEIGVRKVLGASVTKITTLLSMDFMKLVLISLLIGSLAAWWAMNKWLKDFPYHITIGLSVFVLAAIIVLLIALLTVSFQTIKAAIVNPVKSLRTE